MTRGRCEGQDFIGHKKCRLQRGADHMLKWWMCCCLGHEKVRGGGRQVGDTCIGRREKGVRQVVQDVEGRGVQRLGH